MASKILIKQNKNRIVNQLKSAYNTGQRHKGVSGKGQNFLTLLC